MSMQVKELQIVEILGALYYGVSHNHIVDLRYETPVSISLLNSTGLAGHTLQLNKVEAREDVVEEGLIKYRLTLPSGPSQVASS